MEEIQSRLPEIYEIITSDVRDKEWGDIKSELEKLNWLIPWTPIEIIKNYLEITDLFGTQLISFPDKFSILQISQVSYFINTLIFQLSNKQDKKSLCELAKDYVSTLKFFKVAREALSIKNENIEDILENIHKIYKEISSYILIAFMHLSKKFQKINKKEFFVYVNDFFYHEVLITIQYTHKHNPAVREICSQYEKKPTQYGGPSWKYSIKVFNNLYFGEFDENGKRCGFGRLSLENGDKYEGFWENDSMHGQGLYIWKKNGWYKGEFVSGEMTGKGTRSYYDKSVYEGEFFKGKKHGFGKMQFNNGDLYEGMWNADTMTGEGVYSWKKTLDKFKGKFRYDKRINGLLVLNTGEEFKISN